MLNDPIISSHELAAALTAHAAAFEKQLRRLLLCQELARLMVPG